MSNIIEAELLDFISERDTIRQRRDKVKSFAPDKVSDMQKHAALREAKDIVALLSAELEQYEEPKWKSPMTWMPYSASELSRGDAIRIEDSGVIHTYIYLKKLAWWRSKTANILIGHKDNPDKQKRIGECDFVFAFKGYINAQQLARLGVDLW